MAELARPWSAVELGVSIEVIADFIERDVEEARQKAAALGLSPNRNPLSEEAVNEVRR
jgi:hypothetical protein